MFQAAFKILRFFIVLVVVAIGVLLIVFFNRIFFLNYFLSSVFEQSGLQFQGGTIRSVDFESAVLERVTLAVPREQGEVLLSAALVQMKFDSKELLKLLPWVEEKAEFQIGVSVPALEVRLDKHLVQLGEVDIAVTAGEQVVAELTFGIGGESVLVRGTVQHGFGVVEDGEVGFIDLKFESPRFSGTDNFFSKIVQPWDYPFSATAGRFSGSVQIRWRMEREAMQFQEAGAIQVEGLKGAYGNIRFTGLSTSGDFLSFSPLKTRAPVRVSISTIEDAISFKNIKAEAAVSGVPSALRFTQAKAEVELLGGKLSARDFTYQMGEKSQFIPVKIDRINLGEILELYALGHVSGSGHLSGVIPLKFQNGLLSVEKGSIFALAPGGVLKLEQGGIGESLNGTHSGMQVARAVLENFVFENLGGTADYAEDGTLKLGLHLQGRNPQYRSGQSVKFNLNIEENIPALLKSLSVAEAVKKQAVSSVRK